MLTKDAEMLIEISDLRAENERLRWQLDEMRKHRAELSQMIADMMPPFDLPSEEEMREQMKNLVSAEEVLRGLDKILENGGK